MKQCMVNLSEFNKLLRVFHYSFYTPETVWKCERNRYADGIIACAVVFVFKEPSRAEFSKTNSSERYKENHVQLVESECRLAEML